MIDESRQKFDDRERSTARLLHDEGCDVVARPRPGPDADVYHSRGLHATVTEFTKPDADSVEKRLRKKAARHGARTDHELMVECRGTRIRGEAARRDLENFTDRNQPFDRIRVVGDGFDWEYRRKPPKHEERIRSYAEESQRLRDKEAARRQEQVRANLETARKKPPPYLTDLGERPPDGREADRWDTTVRKIEEYRAEHGITDKNSALGLKETPDPERNAQREAIEKAIREYRSQARGYER